MTSSAVSKSGCTKYAIEKRGDALWLSCGMITRCRVDLRAPPDQNLHRRLVRCSSEQLGPLYDSSPHLQCIGDIHNQRPWVMLGIVPRPVGASDLQARLTFTEQQRNRAVITMCRCAYIVPAQRYVRRPYKQCGKRIRALIDLARHSRIMDQTHSILRRSMARLEYFRL